MTADKRKELWINWTDVLVRTEPVAWSDKEKRIMLEFGKGDDYRQETGEKITFELTKHQAKCIADWLNEMANKI